MNVLITASRYGLIVTLIAKRQILPGEEVTVNYNYHQAIAPAWYKEVYFKENPVIHP